MEKKIFLLACATITLATSCSQNEILEVAAQQEISVSSFINKTSANTRTSVSGKIPSKYEIGVTAFKQKSDEDFIPAFTNKKALDTDKDNTWAFSPAQYWDSAFKQYRFHGYTPYTANVTINETTLTYKNFIVKAAKADQQDLMVADVAIVPTATRLSLNFRHMLANINYQLAMGDQMGTEDIATVTAFSVNFADIESKGNLAYTYAADTLGTATWTEDGTKGLTAYKTAAPIELQNTTAGSRNIVAVEEASDLLMIPQVDTEADTDSMAVSLAFEINGQIFNREFAIAANWEANKKYTYTIIIGMDTTNPDGFKEITFTTEVEDFTDGTSEEYDQDGDKLTPANSAN